MYKAEKYLLALWFIANVLIAALSVHEYGMSVDEPNNQGYAADTLDAYPSLFGILYEPNYSPSYDGHGPAFVTLALLFVRVAQALFPNAYTPDLWHFAYFITLPLAGLCMYSLTKRWFNMWTAWGILILFSTQPLLRGHAFINPKDIPFMFFLTLSVWAGFRIADRLEAPEPYVSLETPARTLKERFQRSDHQRRREFLIFLTLFLAGALALLVFSGQINLLLGRVVTFFYEADPDSWAGRIFSSVSSPGVPVEDYISKASRLFDRFERGILVSGVIFFLAYSWLLINNTTLSGLVRDSWAQRNHAKEWVRRSATLLKNSISASHLKIWSADFFRALRSPHVLLAGVALGLATGIRAIGPLAGAIVFLYLLTKVRSRAWGTGIAYFLVTGVMTYIAWPRLWDAPIQRYLEALGIASNFPHYPGRVLFDGQLYSARELPGSYLPVLLNIQLTEPLLLCVYIGLSVLVWRLLRGRLRMDLLLFISLGFVLPFFGLILLNSTLYNNFRQTLFLVPALVMIAAFALELLFSKLRQNWVRVLLIGAMALPGVYSSAKLYPYEYVYYNSLVGGPAGAATRYELDYWRISLREMALELNKVAAPGSLIVVTRSAGLLARYTRPDLVVDKPINSILDLEHGYDYIVQVTRTARGDLYPEVSNLIVVERAGTVLATAKDVKNASRK
jgi:4-amino-4-deoxy-L-arabinose transferase-like glycosyltransferase